MDYNIFIFFVGLAIVLWILSRLIRSGWVSLSIGWIAGGIMLVIGYIIANGEEITSTVVIDTGSVITTALDMGISSENTFIVLALLGIVMIFSSSGDWI